MYCNELPFLPHFESAGIIEEFTFVNSKFKVFSINRSEYPLLQKISFINCIITCKDLDQVRAIEGVSVVLNNECLNNEVTTPASSVLTSTMLTGTAPTALTSRIKSTETTPGASSKATQTTKKSTASTTDSEDIPIEFKSKHDDTGHVAIGVVGGLLLIAIIALVVVTLVKNRAGNNDDNTNLVDEGRQHRIVRNRDSYPMTHSAVVGISNQGYGIGDEDL